MVEPEDELSHYSFKKITIGESLWGRLLRVLTQPNS